MRTTMYEQVLQLPIFQGLSSDQLTALIEKVPFRFAKYKGGEVIVPAGEACTDVLFLVAGEVACQTTFAADPRQPRTTSVVRTQHFQAPHTLQVTHLFGLETSQPEQIRATGEVGIMSLAKADFLTALQLNRILLVNTLNIISSHAQRAGNMLRHVSQLDETGRLAYWLLHYTTRSAYDIRVVSTPETWSRLLLTDVRGYWKAVTLLEKTKAIESQGDDLILLDRYILRKFVDEKLVP